MMMNTMYVQGGDVNGLYVFGLVLFLMTLGLALAVIRSNVNRGGK